jgi:hypothetical protein
MQFIKKLSVKIGFLPLSKTGEKYMYIEGLCSQVMQTVGELCCCCKDTPYAGRGAKGSAPSPPCLEVDLLDLHCLVVASLRDFEVAISEKIPQQQKESKITWPTL